MMRALLLAGAALIATPAAAQDHSGHGNDTPPQEQPEPDHSEHQDQSAEDNHQAMDHSQHEQETDAHADHGAMDHGAMDHSQHGQMDHDMSGLNLDIPAGPPPPEAFEGPQHAADEIWGAQAMAPARAYNHQSHGNATFGVVLAERLEARIGEGHDEYLWDVSGWYGTATDRVVFKSEGEGEFGGELDDAEVQLLWAHAIGPWFDLQAGVRLDIEPDTTPYLALGVQGLAPYMIYVDATAFLSDDGDLTARVEVEHDMRLTQQLVLQPRVEFELAAQDIPERGIGAGIPKVELGARLRYEFVPEFAPYIGVEYETATGRTADIIRAGGDDPSGFVFLIGLRTWF
ncbi:copper resistance protein B [Aurantiacibacter sp. D1-12]|uniref:copper resistance protein B n=1 Tax=Aurantiacibacter sp. D1-12 TaxID=2993658 RepID=UPI00237CA65A|nr:copper resistance protein B [Aurantiacibacter sp. D1-12]MDE1468509.1 copper resistance protein B [Aurantiacibacter sp. D1-12]